MVLPLKLLDGVHLRSHRFLNPTLRLVSAINRHAERSGHSCRADTPQGLQLKGLNSLGFETRAHVCHRSLENLIGPFAIPGINIDFVTDKFRGCLAMHMPALAAPSLTNGILRRPQ